MGFQALTLNLDGRNWNPQRLTGWRQRSWQPYWMPSSVSLPAISQPGVWTPQKEHRMLPHPARNFYLWGVPGMSSMVPPYSISFPTRTYKLQLRVGPSEHMCEHHNERSENISEFGNHTDWYAWPLENTTVKTVCDPESWQQPSITKMKK